MTNEQKFYMLRDWLADNRIEHWESVAVGETGIIIPLYLPLTRIAVRIGDDQAWYMKIRSFVAPIIIRDDDTIEFVIEKVRNTIDHQKELVKRHHSFCSYDREHRRNYVLRRRQKFRKSLTPRVKHCVSIKTAKHH